MREHHLTHGGEIDTKFVGVPQHGFRTIPRVHQNAASIRLDEGGKSPFADALIRQHGGKNRHF